MGTQSSPFTVVGDKAHRVARLLLFFTKMLNPLDTYNDILYNFGPIQTARQLRSILRENSDKYHSSHIYRERNHKCHYDDFIYPTRLDANTWHLVRYMRCRECGYIEPLYVMQFDITTAPPQSESGYIISEHVRDALRFANVYFDDAAPVYLSTRVTSTWEQWNAIRLIRRYHTR